MSNSSRSPDDICKEAARSRREFERRRVPRLCLATEQFRLQQNGRIFPLVDLSNGGMALRLLDREDLALFPVGAKFSGILNLRRDKYPVKAQVRHLGTELVGCEFEELDERTREAIMAFLDPGALGRELRPIPADGTGLWYHGPSGTDLLFWRHMDGQYSRLLLFVLGSYVQWEESEGLTTGRWRSSLEQSEVRGVIRLETILFDADAEPDREKLSIALKLLSQAPIPQDMKNWCARHLSIRVG